MTESSPVVLVIDDDREIRMLLQEVLVQEGYRVLIAGTAEVGQAQCLFARPALVLVDYRLPGRNGDEFITWYRDDFRSSGPVIAMSASRPPEWVTSHETFIAKPFDLGVLLEAVRAALARTNAQPEPEPMRDDQPRIASECAGR